MVRPVPDRRNKTCRPGAGSHRVRKKRAPEEWPVEDERVEFPVFTRGIHPFGQIPEKGMIHGPARKGPVEAGRVHAGDDGPEPRIDERAGENPGVSAPEGEKAPHAGFLHQVFPVSPDVLEENIPEGDLPDARRPAPQKGFFHRGFVCLVRAGTGDENLLQGAADRSGLPLDQDSSDAVHADPVKVLRKSAEQGCNLAGARLSDVVNGKGAVLSAAPGHDDLFPFTHRCISGREGIAHGASMFNASARQSRLS